MVLVLIPTSKNRSSRELRWTSSKAAVRSTEPLPSWAKIMAGHAGCHWESTISRWNQDWFKGKFTGKAPYFIGKSMKGFQIQTNQSIPRWNPQYWYSTSQPSPTLLLKWVVLTIKIWMLYYCFTKTLIIFELRCPRATMDFFPSLSIVPTLSMFVHRPTSHGKKRESIVGKWHEFPTFPSPMLTSSPQSCVFVSDPILMVATYSFPPCRNRCLSRQLSQQTTRTKNGFRNSSVANAMIFFKKEHDHNL